MRLTLSALAVAALVGFGSVAQAAPVSSSMGAGVAQSDIIQVAKKKKAKKAKKSKRMSGKAAKRV
jgi:hypothetical protein